MGSVESLSSVRDRGNGEEEKALVENQPSGSLNSPGLAAVPALPWDLLERVILPLTSAKLGVHAFHEFL